MDYNKPASKCEESNVTHPICSARPCPGLLLGPENGNDSDVPANEKEKEDFMNEQKDRQNNRKIFFFT